MDDKIIELEVEFKQDILDLVKRWSDTHPEIKGLLNFYKIKSTKFVGKSALEPIRHEIFDPPKEFLEEYKKHNLKFTVGKKYPIFAEVFEKNLNLGMRYITNDDDGNRRSINSVHFTQEQMLDYENTMDVPMPDLRDIKTRDSDTDGVANWF